MRITLTLIMMFFILQTANSQTYFEKRYDRLWTQVFGGLQTSDDGYIIYGEAAPDSNIVRVDMSLIKTDSNGDTIWTKLYGTPSENEQCYSVQQTRDQGYIILGTVSNNGYHSCLMKTDSLGNLIWTKEYRHPSGSTFGLSLIQTSDSCYLIMEAISDTNLTHTLNIIKTDSSGDVIWSRSCIDDSISISNNSKNIIPTIDGNFVFAGSYAYSNGFNKPESIVKFDLNGDTIWTKQYSTINGAGLSSIKQILDGGYIVLGATQDTVSSTRYILAMRLDSTGNLIWSKKYHNISYSFPNDLICLPDGSYIICANDFSTGNVLCLDSVGNILWSKQTGNSSQPFECITIDETFDNNLVLFGKLGPPTSNVILKTNLTVDSGCIFSPFVYNVDTLIWSVGGSVGLMPFPVTANIDTTITITSRGFLKVETCMSVGINEKTAASSFNIYPNPVNNELHFMHDGMNSGKIKIYNVLGGIEMSEVINKEIHVLDVSTLAPGIHFMELIQGEKIFFGKFVKE